MLLSRRATTGRTEPRWTNPNPSPSRTLTLVLTLSPNSNPAEPRWTAPTPSWRGRRAARKAAAPRTRSRHASARGPALVAIQTAVQRYTLYSHVQRLRYALCAHCHSTPLAGAPRQEETHLTRGEARGLPPCAGKGPVGGLFLWLVNVEGSPSTDRP